LDKGGKHLSNEFVKLCQNSGIIQQFTQTKTPQQNVMVERMNHSLLDKARSTMFENGTPNHLWVEAINIAYPIYSIDVQRNLTKKYIITSFFNSET
jgi:transposase InsO family protein